MFAIGEKERLAIVELKKALTKKPVLQLYNAEAETTVHTDASKLGYGAIMMQRSDEDWKFHPIHFYSKKTTK